MSKRPLIRKIQNSPRFQPQEGYLDRNCPTMECCYTTCSGSLAGWLETIRNFALRMLIRLAPCAAAMSWFHSSPTEFARSTRYRTPVAGDCYCWTERMLNDGGDGLHQFSYDPSSVTTLMFESCDISNSSISREFGFLTPCTVFATSHPFGSPQMGPVSIAKHFIRPCRLSLARQNGLN